MCAASNNALRCMRLLLRIGANVDERAGLEGGTALHIAAYAGVEQVLSLCNAHLPRSSSSMHAWDQPTACQVSLRGKRKTENGLRVLVNNFA